MQLSVLQLVVGITALVIAVPSSIYASVNLYEKFSGKRVVGPDKAPVSWALRISNVLGFCLLAFIVIETWFGPWLTKVAIVEEKQPAVASNPGSTSSTSSDRSSGNSQPLTQGSSGTISSSGSNSGGHPYIMDSVQHLWSSLCENHTEVQCDAMMQNIKGDWIAIEGIVGSAFPSGVVTLTVDKKRSVTCSFDESWLSQILALHKNDRIKVQGMIDGFANGSLLLLYCEKLGSL